MEFLVRLLCGFIKIQSSPPLTLSPTNGYPEPKPKSKSIKHPSYPCIVSPPFTHPLPNFLGPHCSLGLGNQRLGSNQMHNLAVERKKLCKTRAAREQPLIQHLTLTCPLPRNLSNQRKSVQLRPISSSRFVLLPVRLDIFDD